MEEHATKVSVQKDDKMNNMNDKSSGFYRIHVHLQPYYPWEDGNNLLASEDYKMKDNCEGYESAPSLPVSEPKINAKDGDTANDDKRSFGSDPKEEKKSDLKSLFELLTEVEDKPPPAGYELGKLKEKNMMHRDEHSSEFWNPLQHDEAEMTGHDMHSNLCPYHMSFQPSKIPCIAHH